MRIDVVTLFPDLVRQVAEYGVAGRAVQRGLLSLHTWNPRDYTHDRHRTVDDRPYGGGPGMVMRYEPLRDAIRAVGVESPGARVIYLSPQGRLLTQETLRADWPWSRGWC
jgi:tRNA (guanine37-N1)-methyltransferase